MSEQCIAAISTAAGKAAIGVIRVSGKGSIEILASIFKPAKKFESHKMYYGHIVYGDEVIDEVMVCAFFSPKSFTTEDMAEIYAHGGMLVLGKVLDTVIKSGARLAKPGEFTQRAFLNGRIGLTEAEAVMDIIGAKSETARRVGLRQLGGSLSIRINHAREKILLWIAHIELSIDYPEHEDEAKNARDVLEEAPELVNELNALLETASIGRIIKTGIRTAIIGRPNVGKSTLLNYFLSENRAIVHDLPGTTRDVLMEEVRIGNLPLVLMDTAGIRKSSDVVEQIGIDKTYEAARDADLVLYVVDATAGLTDEDNEILTSFNGAQQLSNPLEQRMDGDVDCFATLAMTSAKILLLYNKADIPNGIVPVGPRLDSPAGLTDRASPAATDCLFVSAKTGFGMGTLFNKLESMFLAGAVTNESTEIITRDRHKYLLEEALNHLTQTISDLQNHVHEDLVSISLRLAYTKLGEILGEEIRDDIADKIFSEFCVGK